MKAHGGYIGTVHDRGGSRALEFARIDAPGPGMAQTVQTRFCCICADDVKSLGGRFLGPLFLCAIHRRAA